MTKVHSGGCRCGAVRFSASKAPNFSVYCHCDDCRRANAAPVVAYIGFMADAVSWEKDGYKPFVNGAVRRTFCPECGTPISFSHESGPDRIFIFTAIMDRPEDYPPTAHTFATEQLSWLHLDDDLPRHTTTLLLDFNTGKSP